MQISVNHIKLLNVWNILKQKHSPDSASRTALRLGVEIKGIHPAVDYFQRGSVRGICRGFINKIEEHYCINVTV